MVESHDKLIMEFTYKYGYNRSDEDAYDEDDDNGGDTATPLLLCHLVPAPPGAAPEVIIIDEEDTVEMVPEQEAPEAHNVILAEAEPKPPQPRLYTVLMRDYE
jgi:hypothetical protein